jgi:predicted CxxxxCH...CXXCH cytochrome family protein
MSSTVSWTKTFCMIIACGTLFGCSAANDQAPALNSTNAHPSDWRTAHRSAYRQKPDSCRECHGDDLTGGITKIGCSVASCHAGNHPPRSIIHEVPFKGTDTLNKAHGSLAKKDLTVCQDCHGLPGSAGSNPRFNLTYGSLPAGCESSGCHNQFMAHPKPWNTHGSAGNQANACALCHGANFEGSAATGAPACSSCHSRLIGVQLPVAGTCNSCHGNPPDGVTTPNRAGSHVVHLALPELQNNCNACHDGGGSGTPAHLDKVFGNYTVAFLSGYSAQSGAVRFNKAAETCSNVKCHGGQTTPAWGGHIAGCTSCHASGTAQYNSFNSGKHDKHINEGLACTDCHDTVKLAPGHFSNLSSSTINQPAGNTLKNYLNYTKPSCSPASAPVGNQVGVCHGTRTW